MTAGRRPESVLVVVHAGRRVLVLRRVRPFEFWQSVTGSLEVKETPRQAAIRELDEETGIDGHDGLVATGVERVFTIDPRWRDRYPPGVEQNREHEFRLPLAEPVNLRIDPREHSAWRWIDVDEGIELAWSSTNKAAFRDLRAEL